MIITYKADARHRLSKTRLQTNIVVDDNQNVIYGVALTSQSLTCGEDITESALCVDTDNRARRRFMSHTRLAK